MEQFTLDGKDVLPKQQYTVNDETTNGKTGKGSYI